MHRVTVREHARLTTSTVPSSLDQATVSASAFDWLCRESGRLRKSGAALVELDDRRWLRLDNYVGVIETPCGTQVEILPKTEDGHGDVVKARSLLRTMLSRCLDLAPRETAPSDIQAFRAPLTEWVMRQFLEALDRLVKRGVRFDYQTVKEQQRFLRGRLDMARQLRQPPGRQHLFQIEHDVFEPDRPENRLLRSALDRVCQLTRESGNWRLSHELATYLSPISASSDVTSDFRRWRKDRLMAHYQPLRPWCELILSGQNPLSIAGEWRGMSLLFPMEKVFERYVEGSLRRQLSPGITVKRAASTEFLCDHRASRWFNLQPDLLVEYAGKRLVLDTKWKRVHAALDDPQRKYNLNQADFYQLFAYGHKYMSGAGDLLLVYPKSETFQEMLQVFTFSTDMRLWVVPFDLETESIIGMDIRRLAEYGIAA